MGERYDIDFGRWPGRNIAFDTLATPDFIARILTHPEFTDFYSALDGFPEIVTQNYDLARASLQLLEMKLPDDSALAAIGDYLSNPPGYEPQGPDEATAFFNAVFEIGWRAAVEQRQPQPDAALISAVKGVYSLFNFTPHLRMHLWAGGLAPWNANLRGTVTYFNELCVDPVFWMLHGELDRYWYTWEEANNGQPPLEGDDAIFNPLTADEGAWYGGGKTYTLDELTSHDALPYTYQ